MFNKFRLKQKIRRENVKSRVAQRKALSLLNLSPAALSELREFKRSDVLYIFGSGESVCALEKEQWKEIGRKDSLGMNLWTIHPHVPNFYTFEVPRIEQHREVMIHNLRIRANDYSQTAFLFKGGSEFDERFADAVRTIAASEDLYIFVPTYFTVGDEHQFIYLLENYDKITKNMRESMPDALFRKRASVVFSTMLGYDLGFKDIVFCGIDGIAGSGYFYESKAQPTAPGTIIPNDSGQQQGAIHKTMDPQLSPLTADKCLQLINTHLFKKSDVNMWVGTQNSILSEWLPAWHWDL